MAKDKQLSKFYAFLAKPLFFRARFALALLVGLLALAITQPLWRIQIYSPQYASGLTLDIYAHQIDSGRGGADLRDINILHHYIGMHPIDRQDLSDLDWMPFALGLIAILALRCAAVGDVRSLVDVVVMTFYVSAFAMARFFLKMQAYGENLDPDAPVKVSPFSPPLFGSSRVGEIMTFSTPRAGSYLVALFAAGALAILVYHLVVGRRSELGAR
ncbi:MAG TPA: hypothetical protein VLM85_10355 [Polyangiaceae bacterium]|nr:hypothetical protein [Polyangiaceae bacterium]